MEPTLTGRLISPCRWLYLQAPCNNYRIDVSACAPCAIIMTHRCLHTTRAPRDLLTTHFPHALTICPVHLCVPFRCAVTFGVCKCGFPRVAHRDTLRARSGATSRWPHATCLPLPTSEAVLEKADAEARAAADKAEAEAKVASAVKAASERAATRAA